MPLDKPEDVPGDGSFDVAVVVSEDLSPGEMGRAMREGGGPLLVPPSPWLSLDIFLK